MTSQLRLYTLIMGLLVTAAFTNASTDTMTPPSQTWSFTKSLGTFDRAALQRGFQVYKEVCATCHGLSRINYRNLKALGYTDAQIKAIAAEVKVTNAKPNDAGEMFERPGLPSDHFKNPYPNDEAARAANNGALPPDLSLIVKARKHGANYIYALLTGYTSPPPGFTLQEGLHYNVYFPGQQIAMPAPLSEGLVTYSDGTKATVEQMAHDVTTFLAWAAEPEMEERKRLGLKVLLYLMVMTTLLYFVMRRVWQKLQ